MEKKINDLFIENVEKECRWLTELPPESVKKPVFQDEFMNLSSSHTEFTLVMLRWHDNGYISCQKVLRIVLLAELDSSGLRNRTKPCNTSQWRTLT